MPIYKAPTTDIRFVLEHVLNIADYANLEGFGEFGSDDLSALLNGGAKICEEVIQPLNQSGDLEGCRFDDGTVTTPEGFRRAYKVLAEGGWIGLASDPTYGGQGLPGVLAEAFYEMLSGANMAFSGYVELSEAVFAAIYAHGDAAQKQIYLPKLAAGHWTGAMHLTESQAGSDLRLIKTKAVPQDDGTYRLYGSKTFITNAEHDLSENIVNLVLARLPDAPAGTRGLSLFIVPKYLADENGEPGTRNGVFCSSLEHKMGLRAAPTGVINYEAASGFLLGERNQGISAMFTMVNDARMGVALQGLSIAEVAYQNAAAYARERRQGRSLLPGNSQSDEPVAIIEHPDVRRMLLSMRAFTEGARALGLWVALQIDLSKRLENEDERAKADGLVALLTPVIKAYFTDAGCEAADMAIQCFGGYGYVQDSGVEQFLRDVRITRIYEGTNGIQALDLVRRKLDLQEGRPLSSFFGIIEESISAARQDAVFSYESNTLARALEDLHQAAGWMRDHTRGDVVEAAGGSTDFLRLFALVAMGWMWMRMMVIAQRELTQGRGNLDFWRAKLTLGRFFFRRMLPETRLLNGRAMAGASDLMQLSADEF